MIYTSEHNKIYNSIVLEFQISGGMLEEMKMLVESLVKSRVDLCKLLKIENAKAETLDFIKQKLIRSININECSIRKNQKNKIELLVDINKRKEDIKGTKSHINKLENELCLERQKSRKLREDFYAFVSREKFKIIKKYFVKKYKIVFAKYSNELSIKIEIQECNERKNKLRKEKQNYIYSMEKDNRKITIDKIKMARCRKSIIKMGKAIEIFNMRISDINDYSEMEDNLNKKCKRIN